MYRGGDGIARKHHCDCVWLYVYDCVCVWHEYAATAPGSTTQLYHDSAATTPWTSNRQTHRHHHRWWRLLNQLRHTHTASTLAAGRHRSQRHLKPTPSHREPVRPRHVTVDSSGRLHRGSITSITGMVARRGTLSHAHPTPLPCCLLLCWLHLSIAAAAATAPPSASGHSWMVRAVGVDSDVVTMIIACITGADIHGPLSFCGSG